MYNLRYANQAVSPAAVLRQAIPNFYLPIYQTHSALSLSLYWHVTADAGLVISASQIIPIVT
jgi:hypothetical protein